MEKVAHPPRPGLGGAGLGTLGARGQTGQVHTNVFLDLPDLSKRMLLQLKDVLKSIVFATEAVGGLGGTSRGGRGGRAGRPSWLGWPGSAGGLVRCEGS